MSYNLAPQAPALQKQTYSVSSNEQWDLSSLLLAQMGYDQPPGNNFPVTVPSMESPPSVPGNIARGAHRTIYEVDSSTIPRNMQMHTGSDSSTRSGHSFGQEGGGYVPAAPGPQLGFEGGRPPGPSPFADSLIDMNMWISASKPSFR
jgi:hypothetical protein